MPHTRGKVSRKIGVKFTCSCGAKFRWLSEAEQHLKRVRTGEHRVQNVTGQYVEGLMVKKP